MVSCIGYYRATCDEAAVIVVMVEAVVDDVDALVANEVDVAAGGLAVIVVA